MGQEAVDDAADKVTLDLTTFQWNAGSKRITNVANPTADQDAATKHYLENTWLSTADKTAITALGALTDEIGRLGTVAAVADLAILGTSAIVTDLDLLATSANVTAMGLLGVSGVITDMGLLGTSAVITDMDLLGTSAVVTDLDLLGTSANVTNMATLGASGVVTKITTVAGISANVTTVAGISSDVTAVAGKATEIGLLGVSGVITDMGLLGTSAVVTDLDILGTADVVSDMNTLASSAIVTDMDLLATSANVTAMGLLGTSANVTAMGLLGNSTTIADMAILATTDIVTDLAQLATTDFVADLNQLATTDFVADLTAIEAIKANVTTVADNLTGVNNFAARYRTGSSDPVSSLDEGDLAYNTTSNVLKYYNGSAWITIVAGSLTDIVQDGSPQLGGDLDLNGNSIDFPTTPNISDVLDEDAMGSNSATKLATQQSIKAYVDNASGKTELYGFKKTNGSGSQLEDLIMTYTNGNDTISVSNADATQTDLYDESIIANQGLVFAVVNGQLQVTV